MDTYSEVRTLGQGGFGTVYLVTHKVSKKQYALKKVLTDGLNNKLISQTLQEVQLLKRLNHAHILMIEEASMQGFYVCMYTEYCPNGDIGRYIEINKGTVMDERNLLLWIRQITEALQYIHGHHPKIIHRDLKPDNIFLDENWNTKLGDFGIARVLASQTSKPNTICGTQFYMGPEIVARLPYNEKVDIYSLGIMMYEMCQMETKFDAAQLIYKKRTSPTLLPLPRGYNDDINVLLKPMMSEEPNDRPSATEILEHNMFTTT